MRKTAALGCVCLVLGFTVIQAQQALPITQVLLYKNGMAYIVRSGQLTTPLTLTFHPEDMNDVLKSFTAWNPEGGSLYAVGYTAGIPSRYMLSRFPFDMGAPDVGLSGFLTQVKGADVRLAMAGSPLEGRLVAVQPAERVVSSQTTSSDHRLTVMIKSGSLQTVWLSDVRGVDFTDPQLRDQLRSYLDVLAETRQDVTREVSVYPVPSPGPIRVSYLQQFPLWKTSYRVDLGEAESQIQGWAQIDNPTGESWNNVEVALLSGSPVSFNMNLYEPLYTRRSTVAVPGGQVAGPRQYEAALRPATGVVREGGVAGGVVGGIVGGLAVAPPSALGGRGSGAGTGGGTGRGIGPGAAPLSSARIANESGLDASFQQADASEFEDFFEYRFPFPIQLASRQSALLPFLQKTMKIERLSIFNAVDRGNARLGAQLENVTGMPLEPGPATFFESGRYAGEAVLSRFARGEKRLVSYGVDHDVQVSFKQQSEPETTTRLTIARGVAVVTKESSLATLYEIRNKGSARTLLVEHPRVADRKLAGVKPWETTDGFYRFRLALNAESTIELPVSEIVSWKTEVSLGTLTRDGLVALSGPDTPRAIREKLGQLVDLQEQKATLQKSLQSADSEQRRIVADQERLRENIKALKDTRDDQELRRRYLAQLTKQEDELQALRTRMDTILTGLAAAQQQFDDAVGALAWEPNQGR